MTDRELRERARAVIPGGMYGHQAAPGPAYPQSMRGGRGARVWDVDWNEYVDLMCSYIGFVLVYTVLIMVVLSFPAPFHGADKVLGYGLAVAAAWYFGGLLWQLRKGTAGVKPVEDLADPAPPAG